MEENILKDHNTRMKVFKVARELENIISTNINPFAGNMEGFLLPSSLLALPYLRKLPECQGINQHLKNCCRCKGQALTNAKAEPLLFLAQKQATIFCQRFQQL